MSQHATTYGLILTKKAQLPQANERRLKPQQLSYFETEDDAADSEDTAEKPSTIIKAEPHALNAKAAQHKKALLKASTQLQIADAFDQDQSIFEYDNVYDDIVAKKEAAQVESSREKIIRKPKYVQTLLNTAAQRNLDREIYQERVAKREREAEGEEFADKEQFVTTAYRKKLESMREAEELQRQRDKSDAAKGAGNQDMGSFYKHVLQQRVGEETPVIKLKSAEQPTPNISGSKAISETSLEKTEQRTSADLGSPDNSDEKIESTNADAFERETRSRSPVEKHTKFKRSHRKRSSSPDLYRHSHHSQNDSRTAKSHGRRRRSSSSSSSTRSEKSTAPAANSTMSEYARRTTDEEINAARLRYLQRKQAASK